MSREAVVELHALVALLRDHNDREERVFYRTCERLLGCPEPGLRPPSGAYDRKPGVADLPGGSNEAPVRYLSRMGTVQEIRIAKRTGFCYGVREAIDMAKEASAAGKATSRSKSSSMRRE